ncbi:flagellar basal body rod protein FlgG [Pontibacillus litoralis]|uniref:Flagellar hook protein FlgE n=1 Tax=Pontibacillus litoralis JSM 072002 TaxID=1385512 RepID=A0A0A5HXV7_9BACI|nr:flagellar basal body rod protein FlgG [Pontibacillus litoralis]KGX88442.1 flagellar basal body rod protein FlgG [Pontibacillus litoralis JSM 072002]
MLRSMYAGISGMKSSQTKLDIIGNNVANVNTVGYKKGRVTFSDIMSQQVNPAQGPANGQGGINPSQVGLGSQIASIDNIHTTGFRQTTNRSLDLFIEGDGMFAVSNGEETFYTRAGNFYLDAQGDIVNPSGYYLQDVNNNKINIPADAQSYSIDEFGEVTYLDADGEQQSAGTIALAQFSNPGGLEKAGSNLYRTTDNAGFGGLVGAGTGGQGSIVSGALEMSNVDLAEEFTEMITGQRSFQANTRIITTSDEILQELVNLKR